MASVSASEARRIFATLVGLPSYFEDGELQMVRTALVAFAILCAMDMQPGAAEQNGALLKPSAVGSWTRPVLENRWVFHSPGDPLSPRATVARTGPDYNVYDHDAAVLDLLKDVGLTLDTPMRLERIEVWASAYRADLRAGLANTEIEGVPAIFFMTVKQTAGSDTFDLYAIAMPKSVFEAWGGITWLMLDAGTIDSQTVFEPERRDQIAKASFDKQLELFERAAEFKIERLNAQMNQMMAQQMLVTQMTNLNLDLMFGDLAVSPLAD